MSAQVSPKASDTKLDITPSCTWEMCPYLGPGLKTWGTTLNVLAKNQRPVTIWTNQGEAFREIAEGIRAVAMEVRREKGGG